MDCLSHALAARGTRTRRSPGAKDDQDRPLDRRNVLVVGCGGTAQSFIHGVQRSKGIVSVTAANEKGRQQLAQKFSLRHVPFHNLYDTLADVVVIAEPSIQLGSGKGDINPGYFRPTMTVMDLLGDARRHADSRGGASRGCKVVEPADVFRSLLAANLNR